MSIEPQSVFTLTSAMALATVPVLGMLAYTSSKAILPKHVGPQAKYIFTWMVFDAMSHVVYEASWLYHSTFGRQVNTGFGPFAAMWREYALADSRWGVSDPIIVSMEIVSVLCAGPLCCYILNLLINDDPSSHYWIIVLCTGEMLATWVLFCTEWLIGSPNLNTSNPLYLWVYLFLLNVPWAIAPILLMINSYNYITSCLHPTKIFQKTKGQ